MALKKKINNLILDKSDTYQFYKEQYEKQNHLYEYMKTLQEIHILEKEINKKQINNLNEEIKKLKVEINEKQKNEINNLNEEIKKLKVEINEKQNYEIFNLNEEIKKLKDISNHNQKITNECLDSYNYLFNNIYLDYELKPKKLLNSIHLLTNELLKFISNVCKKYDFLFWLDYGNLLGATRHGDYVPWDDDADIGMIRKDYLKFEKIIEKEIENHDLNNYLKLTYNTRKIDDKIVNTFMTIRIYYKMASYAQKRIICNVDIFPYDFIKDYEKNGFDELCLKSRNTLYRNKVKKVDQKEYMKQYYNELNLSYEKTNFLIPGVDGVCGINYVYNMFILETNRIFPLNEIEFSNEMFPCPKDVHYYLENIYKDYMNIPKILHRHETMKKYRYNTDNDEMFEKCISMLKNANENFYNPPKHIF